MGGESSQISTRTDVTRSPADEPLDRREQCLLIEAPLGHVGVGACLDAPDACPPRLRAR